MALDFSVLQGMDPAGAFFRGQEAVRAEADRNLLRQMQAEQMAAQRENMLAQRQRQQLEMEQTLEDRRRRATQEGQFQKLAGLISQHGMDPDDPKVLGEFAQAALLSGQPQLSSVVSSMAERAAKRREAAAESLRIGAILRPQAAQPAAPQNAMPSAAPMFNALAAPQPDLLAGTPYSIGPLAAPAQPAAAPMVARPDNAAQIAELERQRDALEAMGTPRALAEVKRVEREIERLRPKDQQTRLQDRFVPVGRLVFDRETQQFITPPAAAIAATQDRGAGAAAAPKAPRGYRFTADGELEPIPGGPAAPKPMSPVQEAARRDKIGKEFKAAQTALQTTQDVLDSVSFVRNEPGLTRALGFTGMLPSFPGGQAASADVRLENLKGKVTALGKAAAAATGAIGQIANQEWKILADQIAIIDKIKGEGPLLAQLDLIEAQAKGAMERIRDAYQRQFGEDFERFPQFAELPAPKSVAPRRGAQDQVAPAPASGPRAAPAAPAAAPLTPAEQAELDALRQRFRRPPQ